jgi:hypothetical protein
MTEDNTLTAQECMELYQDVLAQMLKTATAFEMQFICVLGNAPAMLNTVKNMLAEGEFTTERMTGALMLMMEQHGALAQAAMRIRVGSGESSGVGMDAFTATMYSQGRETFQATLRAACAVNQRASPFYGATFDALPEDMTVEQLQDAAQAADQGALARAMGLDGLDDADLTVRQVQVVSGVPATSEGKGGLKLVKLDVPPESLH